MLSTTEASSTVMHSAARGDRDAFASLVRQHQSLVFGLAWNSLRDAAVAEELAQDVFLELYGALSNLESPAHVVNWLRRVTIHRCIDYSRRERNRPRVPLDAIAEPAAPGSENRADPYLSERVRALTASLPPRARAVLVLRYQEELEPPEIAEMLQLPVNTVKSQLHRALALLRNKLNRTRVAT